MVATEEKRLTMQGIASHCMVSTITVRRWIKSGELVAISVVSLKRFNNKATRIIPVLPKGKDRNPEGTYGRFRVKHGMTYCMVIARTLHWLIY